MTRTETAILAAKITAAGVVMAAVIAAIPGTISALKPQQENKIVVVPPPENLKPVPKLNEETAASDVETLRDVSMWDLRGWKPVPKGSENQRISPANYINYLHVRKINAVNEYRAHFSTSGSAIDMRCITHPAKILLSAGSPDHPGEGNKEYEIDVDISKVPVNREFLIVIEATYWNGFQDDKHGATATYTDEDMKQMDELAMFVLMPENKPFKNVQRWDRPTKSPQKLPYQGDERLYQDNAGRFIYWSIANREADHHYQLAWDW